MNYFIYIPHQFKQYKDMKDDMNAFTSFSAAKFTYNSINNTCTCTLKGTSFGGLISLVERNWCFAFVTSTSTPFTASCAKTEILHKFQFED